MSQQRKLYRIKDDDGFFYDSNGDCMCRRYLQKVSILETFTVQNPNSIDDVINGMVKNNSACIPSAATHFVASDFNGGTQHLRKDSETGKESFFSVYAVQFYFVF